MLTADVLRQYHALTKPRVIQLIVFCALIGLVLAIPGWPTVNAWIRILWACLGIWLVAGAAAAFNCLVEKTLDAKMRRTAWRPTARGELSDAQALGFSAALCALGSFILYAFVNPLTMWLTFATFIGYAVVYTVSVNYNRLFPIYAFIPGQSRTISMSATTVLRNQPYNAQQQAAAPVTGNCT